MNTAPAIEPLESRIAPASLLNARTVTYTDGDGDHVTVRISKGTFEDPNDPGQTTWTFTPSATGIVGREQLEIIDLSFFTQFDGANLSITATPSATAGGDGTVSIGYLNATGIDLGSVAIRGDLGAIDAGDANLRDGGLRALSVFSLGGEGLGTGAPDLVSDIVGSVSLIRVGGDISGAQISITGSGASLRSLAVGGSIIGGTLADSGSVTVEGAIGNVNIGGDLLGGSGARTGSLNGARFATVVVGGTIYGGAGADSGQLFAFGAISKVVLGGDLIGGDGNASGVISADAIGSVALDGSVVGGLGANSGRIEVGGNLASLRIGGSLLGGSLFGVGSENSGSIFVGGKLTSAVIFGNLRGGNSEAGFVNDGTGFLLAGAIGSMTIGGSLIGGSDNGGQLFDSGAIRVVGTLGKLVIKGGIFGGDSSGGGQTDGSGYVEADRLLGMSVGGSIFAGSDAGLLSNSGAIRALHDIGTVVVKGSLEGTDTHPVIISAVGQPVPKGATDLAIRAVTVLGRVFKTEILAGYGNDTTNSVFGNAVNADAQIGVVKVGGDWIASDLIAGLATGGDGFFGDAADVKINITGVLDGRDSTAISRIAGIVIGGRVLGEGGGGSVRNGFGAQFVGSMKVGGTAAIPLIAGVGTDSFAGVNGAYPLGQTLGTFPVTPSFNVHVFEVAV